MSAKRARNPSPSFDPKQLESAIAGQARVNAIVGDALSAVFSAADLQRAHAGLPLSSISNEACASYEREHLPSGAWPPTTWFESWARGGNLFDLGGARTPCELRWLVFERAR